MREGALIEHDGRAKSVLKAAGGKIAVRDIASGIASVLDVAETAIRIFDPSAGDAAEALRHVLASVAELERRCELAQKRVDELLVRIADEHLESAREALGEDRDE